YGLHAESRAATTLGVRDLSRSLDPGPPGDPRLAEPLAADARRDRAAAHRRQAGARDAPRPPPGEDPRGAGSAGRGRRARPSGAAQAADRRAVRPGERPGA